MDIGGLCPGPQSPPPNQGGPLKGKKKEKNWEKRIRTGVKMEKGREKGRKKRKKRTDSQSPPPPKFNCCELQRGPIGISSGRADGRHASVSGPLCGNNYTSINEILHIFRPSALVVSFGGHIAYIVSHSYEKYGKINFLFVSGPELLNCFCQKMC